MGFKISALVELLTGQTNDDLIPIVNAGATKKIKFSTLFKNYVDKRSTGILGLTNVTKPVFSLTTEFKKIGYGGIVSLDQSNGHITFFEDRNTLNTDGTYAIRTFGSAGIANNIDVEFSFYKNGEQVNPDSNPIFTGKGVTKPIPISNGAVLEFLAGEYLEIWAKASTATDMTLYHSASSIEKKVFI